MLKKHIIFVKSLLTSIMRNVSRQVFAQIIIAKQVLSVFTIFDLSVAKCFYVETVYKNQIKKQIKIYNKIIYVYRNIEKCALTLNNFIHTIFISVV